MKIEIEMFQFLIGTLKTAIRGIQHTRKDLVSIPDRYSKNRDGIKTIIEAVEEFQFLIGTLKT